MKIRNSRVLNKFLVLVSCTLFCFSSCVHEEVDMLDGPDSFMLEAKAYFEATAPDIQQPRIGQGPGSESRSLPLSSTVIIPEWENARVLENDIVSTVEIPLGGELACMGFYGEVKAGAPTRVELNLAATYLIVQRQNETESYNAFLVTLLGHNELTSPDQVERPGLTFLDLSAFHGVIIVSDVEGNVREVYQQGNDGRRPVKLAKTEGYEHIDTTAIVGKFNLLIPSETEQYSRSGESGGGTGSVCLVCGKRNCDGSCEVLVKYCDECHRPADACLCCIFCRHFPCTCYSPPDPSEYLCPKCGRLLAACTCDDPPSTGGGGSGGNDDNKLTVDNFMERIFTPQFLEKVRQELGVELSMLDEITFVLKPKGNNATYSYKDKTLNINPLIFDNGYAILDITSIVYHELVHVKQYQIDGNIPELTTGDQLKTTNYYFPGDDFYVEEGIRDFEDLMENMGIPDNPVDPNLKQTREYYYNLYVTERERQRDANEWYSMPLNYKYSWNEADAYNRELENYGPGLSPAYKPLVEWNAKKYNRNVYYIENQQLYYER